MIVFSETFIRTNSHHFKVIYQFLSWNWNICAQLDLAWNFLRSERLRKFPLELITTKDPWVRADSVFWDLRKILGYAPASLSEGTSYSVTLNFEKRFNNHRSIIFVVNFHCFKKNKSTSLCTYWAFCKYNSFKKYVMWLCLNQIHTFWKKFLISIIKTFLKWPCNIIQNM